MWRRVTRQPVMIPGILRRRGVGFLPTETGGGGDSVNNFDWGSWWDSIDWGGGWSGGSYAPEQDPYTLTMPTERGCVDRYGQPIFSPGCYQYPDSSLVVPFFPAPPEMVIEYPMTAPAPGVCPRGTYHPPNDPYTCLPFPGSATGTTPARPTPQGTPRPQPTAAGACPKPFVYDPKQKKCVLPPCPQGQTFSITAGKCVPTAQLKPADRVIDREFPWWLIVAGGVLLLAITKPTGGRR